MVPLNDTVPHLIQLGFDKIVWSIGDSFYQMAGANSTSNTNQLMTNMIIGNNDDFMSNSFVLKMKDFNAFWFGLFYILYVFIGAVLVWKRSNDPLPKTGFGYLDEGFNSGIYVKTVVWGLIIFAFAYFGLDYLFKLEYLISQGIALETFNMIPPSTDNAFVYLFGALNYLGLSWFFLIRYYVVGLTTAFILFLLGMWLFPYVRGIVNKILSYALLLLFSRFIIALVMAGGIELIQSLPFGMATSYLPMLVLGSFVSILALIIVLGPFAVLKWAKAGMKAVIIAA